MLTGTRISAPGRPFVDWHLILFLFSNAIVFYVFFIIIYLVRRVRKKIKMSQIPECVIVVERALRGDLVGYPGVCYALGEIGAQDKITQQHEQLLLRCAATDYRVNLISGSEIPHRCSVENLMQECAILSLYRHTDRKHFPVIEAASEQMETISNPRERFYFLRHIVRPKRR